MINPRFMKTWMEKEVEVMEDSTDFAMMSISSRYKICLIPRWLSTSLTGLVMRVKSLGASASPLGKPRNW